MIGCIALYDFDVKQFKLREWVVYCENWMTENGFPPNTIGLPHSGKYLRYSNGKRRLEKENFISSDVDFYGGGEPGTDRFWKTLAYFAEDDKTTYLCFDEENIFFTYEMLEKLIIDLCQFCAPHYAIGFEREMKYGPGSYSIGISHGLKMAYENAEHGQENTRIQKWMKAYRMSKTYKTGDLRDVYRFNMLSQPHVDRLINGQRFEEWVQASPDRGHLKKISDTLWTWWVEPEKIPTVRKTLAPTGMILCL